MVHKAEARKAARKEAKTAQRARVPLGPHIPVPLPDMGDGNAILTALPTGVGSPARATVVLGPEHEL